MQIGSKIAAKFALIFDFRFFRFSIVRIRGHSAIHREEGHIHIHIWIWVSISGSRYASAVDMQRRRITTRDLAIGR
jgi:hypothetical protein